MRLAVFLPNWIGDAVMATPALRALRKHVGQAARIVGVGRPYIADALAGTPWMDDLLLYDPRGKDPSRGGWPLVRRLRAERLDLAVLLPNSFRTALLAWLGGAKRRVGYVRYLRGPLLSTGLAPPRARGKHIPCPMVDYYLALACAVGCPEESPRLELATSASDEAAADAAWKRLGLRASAQVVTMNCSGAFGAAKLWPVEHFAALAGRLVREADCDVLVVCGPSERPAAARIVELAANPRVVSLACEPLSLGLTKACIRRSRLLVTTDSGPRHFAVAFGVPVVGLFGPTPPIWGENATAQAVHLQVDLDCLGCHRRTCPLGHHRCMRDLSVQRVYEAALEQLDQPVRRVA